MDVTFTHESGTPSYKVPGYFVADGNAAETSAASGNKWRAHLSPDKTGKWTYQVSFIKGKNVAVDENTKGTVVGGCDGVTGSFNIAPTYETGRDFRAKGRLTYVGKHYLQFAGTNEYFLKAGADAPEKFLAYREFDGGFAKDGHKDNLVKDWKPHVQDWKPVGASAPATNVQVSDSLNAEITALTLAFDANGYGAGTGIRVTAPNINGGAPLALTNTNADSDGGDFTANAVTASGITLQAGESAMVTFRVVIQ